MGLNPGLAGRGACVLDHNCFVLRMGRKAVGPVCCVMHVKEPRTLIVKEKGLAPVFLDSRLVHPAGWICVRYKSSVLLLLLLLTEYYKRKLKYLSYLIQSEKSSSTNITNAVHFPPLFSNRKLCIATRIKST